MKNHFILVLFLFVHFYIFSQNVGESLIPLTTKSNIYGPTILSISDPYLSPLVYTGLGLRWEGDSRKFISAKNDKISFYSKNSAMYGLTLNPEATSSMTYIGFNTSKGLQYHFRVFEDIQFLVGGHWDAEFAFKNVARNVNNPVSFDVATNLNLAALGRYDLLTESRTYRFQWAVQSPIIGCMFVPLVGASYYEMFSLGNLSDAVHLSSLHNKRAFRQLISVDVPYRKSVWRFGLSFYSAKYAAHNLQVFKQSETSLVLGTTFDMVKFAGQLNKAPKNFRSTND